MRGGLMAQHPMQTHYATRNANLSPFFTGSTGSILCSGFFIHRSPVLSSSGGEWTRVRLRPANQSSGGTATLSPRARAGFPLPTLPIPANAKPSGKDPHAKAGRNREAGILVRPARQAPTSAKTGSARVQTTIHPPAAAKRCSPRRRSFSPTNHNATRRLRTTTHLTTSDASAGAHDTTMLPQAPNPRRRTPPKRVHRPSHRPQAPRSGSELAPPTTRVHYQNGS